MPIEYAYEIETDLWRSGKNNTLLEGEVLPALEKAINDRLFSVLLSSKCGGLGLDVGQRRRGEWQFHPPRIGEGRRGRNLDAVGISARPDEVVYSGVPCEELNLTNSANDCTVVEGALQLYIDGKERDERGTVLTIIKNGMDNDEFLHAHESIAQLIFVNLRPRNYPSAGVGTRSAPEDDNNPGWQIPYIIIGAFVLALLLLLCCALRRRKKDEEDDIESLEGRSIYFDESIS